MLCRNRGWLDRRIGIALVITLLLGWAAAAGGQERVPEQAPQGTPHRTIDLTDEERQWLSEHSTLRLGVGVAFPPFMWVEQQEGHPVFKGMVSDYVNLMRARLGIDLEIVFDIPFNEALARGRAGRIDFFPCLSNTPERSEYLIFTRPYLVYPMVMITREDAPIIGSMDDLSGKRVAAVRHLVVYSKLQNDYPDLDLTYVFTDTVDGNLDAVSTGRADACIINLAVASYYIQQKGFTNLKIAAPVQFEGVQLAMGVRRDWPLFLSIVQKVLSTITQAEKDRISQRWIRFEYEAGIETGRIWRWSLGIGSGVLAVFLLIVAWNRRLKREVVEKEKAEAALRENEERLRNIVENSTNLFYSHTPDHVITYVSPQCREFLECEPEEAMVRWTEFVTDNPINRDGYASTEKAIETGERQPPYEMEVLGKRGKRLVVEVREAPVVKEGKVVSLVGSLTDITHRKRAEEALEKRIVTLTRPLADPGERLSFEDLFNKAEIQRLQDEFALATGVASIITHPDGTPITRPSNFCRLCNDIIRKTELGRINCFRSDAEIGRFNPDGPIIQPCMSGGLWDAGAGISVQGTHIANWLIGQVRDETQTEEKMRQYAREIGADEERVLRAFREVPAMSREQFGQVAQALFTLANQLSTSAYQNVQQARLISELKRAQEEQKRLQSQLIHAQKMESVGRLAGGVAHDFNNLLQVISGYTELIMTRTEAGSATHRHLQNIVAACSRAKELIRHLLLFSRKSEAERRPIDLHREIANVRRILERTISRTIEIELHLGSRLWGVMGDPVQIEQIFLNLGKNAEDAMPDGGKLVIEAANEVLDSEMAGSRLGVAPGKYVRLTVSDTGHGIDPETRELIFEPFFTTKEIGKGTGLGLASTYGIVKSHGGYIGCYSEIDAGTTFKIYLPAIEPAAGHEREGEEALPPEGGGEMILLVDDEPFIRDFASQALHSFGYRVQTADSGERALEIYNAGSDAIDLVILDIGMPGMGGHRCLEEIISLEPSAKVIIASGYSLRGAAQRTMALGAAGYVGKPYRTTDLLTTVRSVLDAEPAHSVSET